MPSRQAVRRPLIEVVSSLENADEMDADAASSQDEDELNLGDVEVDQNIPSADELHSLSCTPGYGFNAAYSAIFRGLDEDGDLLMLRAADEITPVQRRCAASSFTANLIRHVPLTIAFRLHPIVTVSLGWRVRMRISKLSITSQTFVCQRNAKRPASSRRGGSPL